MIQAGDQVVYILTADRELNYEQTYTVDKVIKGADNQMHIFLKGFPCSYNADWFVKKEQTVTTEQKYQFRDPSVGTVIKQLYNEPSVGEFCVGWLVHWANCTSDDTMKTRINGKGHWVDPKFDVIEVPPFEVTKVGTYRRRGGYSDKVYAVAETPTYHGYVAFGEHSNGSVRGWKKNGSCGNINETQDDLVAYIGPL